MPLVFQQVPEVINNALESDQRANEFTVLSKIRAEKETADQPDEQGARRESPPARCSTVAYIRPKGLSLLGVVRASLCDCRRTPIRLPLNCLALDCVASEGVSLNCPFLSSRLFPCEP